MKKLYLVKATVILLFVLCSCSTADSSNLYHDYLLQAENYYSDGLLDEAIQACSQGYSKTKDYRFLYNKAIYIALTGNYEDAYKLCLDSYKKYPDKKIFLNAALKYMEMGNFTEELSSLALSLWENGDYSNEVVKALYFTDSEVWGPLYNALFY